MELDVKLNTLNYDDLIILYNKTKDFISFLNNEIETSEVEKVKK